MEVPLAVPVTLYVAHAHCFDLVLSSCRRVVSPSWPAQIQITKTTFSSFLGSYDGWATHPGISTSSTVDTIEQCFQNCQAYTQAAVSQTATGFDCFCAATQFSFTGANWQPWETNGSSIQFWSHPIGSQVGQSGWVRRQLRERLEMERSQKAMAVCPDSLTACIVPGAEQSFEVGPARRHKASIKTN
jgi:hypothetical protein